MKGVRGRIQKPIFHGEKGSFQTKTKNCREQNKETKKNLDQKQDRHGMTEKTDRNRNKQKLESR